MPKLKLRLYTERAKAKPMALVVPLDPDRRVMCTAPVDVLWCFDNRLVDMRYHDESPPNADGVSSARCSGGVRGE
jgi:hypothetical protein